MISVPREPAPQGASLDVRLLQTAASLENLAVASYAAAARLPAVRDGGPVLAVFLSRSQSQHAAHARAFNTEAIAAGGVAQHAADPRYAAGVREALAGPASAADVTSLLELLEDVNTQSCTRYASLTGSAALRRLFVGISVTEAGHRSFLLAVGSLLTAGAAGLSRDRMDPRTLPRAISTVCCPQAFYPTAGASAINEGAVQ
jgi:hypothetical protein